MFPDLAEVAFCRRCPMCPSSTLPSSPELYALRVPPTRAVCVLLLWHADYVGGLVDLAGPHSSWLPGSASCGGRQLLVDRTMS